MNIHEWAILGLGAIGKLWAGYFLQANQNVELLLRNETALNSFQRKGLTLRDATQTKHWPTPHLASPQTQGAKIHALLITTKTHQTLSALKDFSHRFDRNTQFVLLQNGLGLAEKIRWFFPDNPLFLGITTDGVYCVDTNTIVHAGYGETWIGPAEAATELHGFSTLHRINASCVWSDQIQPRLWQKFAINCAINGLSVIHQCQNGQLLSKPDALHQLENICQEIEQVLAAKSIDLPSPLIALVKHVATQTALNYSSMYQDFKAQRPLELEAMNVYLCQEAARLGLACPYNQALITTIRQMERK